MSFIVEPREKIFNDNFCTKYPTGLDIESQNMKEKKTIEHRTIFFVLWRSRFLRLTTEKTAIYGEKVARTLTFLPVDRSRGVGLGM